MILPSSKTIIKVARYIPKPINVYTLLPLYKCFCKNMNLHMTIQLCSFQQWCAPHFLLPPFSILWCNHTRTFTDTPTPNKTPLIINRWCIIAFCEAATTYPYSSRSTYQPSWEFLSAKALQLSSTFIITTIFSILLCYVPPLEGSAHPVIIPKSLILPLSLRSLSYNLSTSIASQPEHTTSDFRCRCAANPHTA